MQTTIITPTYNKHEFLPEAAESVLRQTCPDWRWWLILDDAEEETKEIAYGYAKLDNRITIFEEKFISPWQPCINELVTDRNPHHFRREAHIRNFYFPRVGTKYLSWLSDDDILEPCFVEVLTSKLEEKDDDIAFGFADVIIKQDGEWQLKRTHAPDCDLGLGQRVDPFTVIDGGQFLQTKRSWEKLRYDFNAYHGHTMPNLLDAVYMKNLAMHFTFYRVPVKVYTKRITYLSTFEKGDK